MEAVLAEVDTPLKRLDPRFKVLSFLALAWAIALAGSLKEIFAFLPVVLLVALPALPHFKRFWKLLLFADSFLILVLATQLFLGSPEVALKVFLRSNEILLLSISLLTTSTLFEILHALHHLKVPNSLLQVAYLTYRYLYEVKERFDLTLKSAYCRGFEPKTSLFTYRTYANLVANLLVHSYYKADRVYRAMLCRGFNGYFPVFRHFKASVKDYLFLVFTTLYGVFVLWKF
ncbi:energy-coupling factor transporter transmembrane component T family protein [Thermovibrio ammonificans]